MARLTKLQREAERVRHALKNKARRELAKRYPNDRAEIMNGDWDGGAGMHEVVQDLVVAGRAALAKEESK